MELLNPGAWFLALAAIPIIAFFFLKVKRRIGTVSTALFWDEISRQHRVHAWGYRFRHPFALALSLFFLALLVSAALDPVVLPHKKANRTIIVFDNSASMNAVDRNGNSRFELARKELLKTISRQDTARESAVITASGEPEIVVGFTDHLPTLRDAVLGVQKTEFPTSLGKAIDVAKILARDASDTRILVFTDGCLSELETMDRDESVTIIIVGEPLENVAITRFQVRRSLCEAIAFDIFTEIANFSDTIVELRLHLELHSREPVTDEEIVETLDLIPVTLEAGAKEIFLARGHTELGGVVTASLDFDPEFEDALSCDNTARTVLGEKTKQKILVFGEDDFFLRKVLESMPNVEIVTIKECPENIEHNSVLVVHQTVPQKLPVGNVLIIDPRNNCDMFEVGDLIETPIIAFAETDTALLKFVRLENILVPGAHQLTFHKKENENRPKNLLATPENAPVFVQYQEKLILTANLSQGDLTLRTAFPILFSNALTFFRGRGGEMNPVANDGEHIACFSCNIDDAEEYDLRYVYHEGMASTHVDLSYRYRSLRFWLVGVAVLFLVFDWFLYQRRWVE